MGWQRWLLFGACAVGLLAGDARALEPSEQEQFMVELINRARLDPAAEVLRLGTGDLNEGSPTLGGIPYTIQDGPHQPLAIHALLLDAASDYSADLEAANLLCHTCLGTDPEERMFGAGYVDLLSDFDFMALAGYSSLYGFATDMTFLFFPGRENLAQRLEGPANGSIDDLTAAVAELHAGLFNDFSVPGRGHRSTLLYGEWQEVGVGIREGVDPGPNDSLYVVIDFAQRADRGPFLTGVAYADLDDDGFYTPDAAEARGALLVQAFEAGTANLVASTATFASGGYSLALGVGTYDVRFSGSGVEQIFDGVSVSVGPEGIGENTKLALVVTPEPTPAVLGAAALALVAALARRRSCLPPDGSRDRAYLPR
jgi:MYXO-CTERM domain-containing protein